MYGAHFWIKVKNYFDEMREKFCDECGCLS